MKQCIEHAIIIRIQLLPQNRDSYAGDDDGKKVERTEEATQLHFCIQQQRKHERNGDLQRDVNEQKRQRVAD